MSMGIKHFKDLSEKRRRAFLEDPHSFTMSEKLDGSNLIFGMEFGQLWTARKTVKERYFRHDEWPKEMWAQNFRFAHQALHQCKYELKAIAGENWVCHAEILSGTYPNTLLYNKDLEQIVVYSGGPINKSTAFIDIDRLTSFDGRTITAVRESLDYHITNIRPAGINFANTVKAIRSLDPEEQNLELVKAITSLKSEYGDTRVEGVVVSHISEGWSFKLVDTTWFTETNKNNYALRRKLFKTPGQKTNSVMDVYTRNLAAGMLKSEAARIALDALEAIRTEYFELDVADTTDDVHHRNLEAMAALFAQLEGVWAEKPSPT